jgi:formylglycine-generating enzyme required for sulfatase activity
MTDASERSLGDDATFAGHAKRQRADVSIGDERTLGDGLAGQETIIDDIDVIDLEARYKIEGTLGQGGMGAVLLATDTRLDRKVAIKRILGEAAGNRMAVNRFLTEAKSIAALNHPNIVQIYDYGRAKDGPFLIMEFVDGGSLLDRCRDGAMPLESAIDLACQLCDGLAKAHDLGIIHRDIKPANVLLTKDGTPKLTDFGLAKAQAGDHGQTMTGAVLGTPDFMPPEQRRDASLVDHRSDLWSLAATVYQMATGRSPKIIRFDLLPPELTKVLGKALEDAKDDRYQTARELRDSLKASLRAAAPDASAIAQGQCPSCGVQNDASRRFCRGCGGSLESPCLSCEKPMPLGEEICGSCGAKQTPLLEARRTAMAAEQAKAEGFLGDLSFDDAARIATQLRDEPHPRLSHLKAWADGFLGDIEKSRSHQVERAEESLVEAHKHEEAHDYLSAIFALDSVPDAMRSAVLPGARETVGKALDRLKKIQAEVRRLESHVKQQVAAKSLDGLLVEVKQLLDLQPDRSDVQKLRAQLVERQTRHAAARDKALASATALLEAHDYEGALSTLSALPESARSVEFTHLHERAWTLVEQVLRLSATIREAVAAKQFEGLHATVDEYLQLKPADAEVLKLRQLLAARDEKIASEIKSRLQQAKVLEQACRFAEAAKVLEVIPLQRRDVATRSSLLRCQVAASERATALKALASASAGEYGSALQAADSYRRLLDGASLEDAEFNELRRTAEAGHAVDERGRRLRRTFAGVAASAAAVLILVCGILWLRSHQRAASLVDALQSARWDDALSIDPDNGTAFLGRARAKLAAKPPDIDGAFTDIDRADKLLHGSSDVQVARGAAHAARAADHARGERLAEAAQELGEAVRLNADAQSLATAHAALGAAWLAGAEKAIAKGDAAMMRAACDSSMKAGVKSEQICRLWLQYGEKCVDRLDTKGLETACTTAEKCGLGRTDIVALWLRFAEESLKKQNAAGVRVACDAALKAGGFGEAVAPLRARGIVVEAIDMWSRGESETAVAKAVDAVDTNAAVGSEMLIAQGQLSKDLREAVVTEYRKRFDTCVANNGWPAAMEAAKAAEKLDPQASSWLKTILTMDRLRLMSRDIIASMPPVRNSLGMDLKLLPAGKFKMGDASGVVDERPHMVTLTEPFFISVHEVTNAQWSSVMGSVPSFSKNDDQPVVDVTWKDAVEFCRKLSAVPAERLAGHAYRLPTEAEWEYACRAGESTRYSFGDEESRLDDYGWFDRNAGGQPHAVGQRKPNAWGLYDMHGNASEWCSDWKGPDAKSDLPLGGVTDPTGPPSGSNRVVRGGCFGNDAASLRSAFRYGQGPSLSTNGVGFRLAMRLTTSLDSVMDEPSLALGSPRPLDTLDWVVLFRSNSPLDWGKPVGAEDNPSANYALVSENFPNIIRYVRLKRMDTQQSVIVPLRTELLVERRDEGRYRWQPLTPQSIRGLGSLLGVFDTALTVQEDKATFDTIVVGATPTLKMYSGWGFGVLWGQNIQGYAWAGRPIRKTTFEIAVKEGELSPDEKRFLLE